MDYQYKFSIIIAVYNVEDYLSECIDSILNQSLDFMGNVQLILVDDGSNDNSLNIAKNYQEKYPENILVLSQVNQGQSAARNNGLKYAKGKYVNFLDSDDYISTNTLEIVYDFFENNINQVDVVAIPMTLFERVNLPHRLNDKFETTRVIDLEIEPNTPQLSSSSAFIKYDSIKDYEFSTKLVNLEDALIINKIFLDKKKYGVINNAEYFYRQRLNGSSTVDLMKENKKYFTDRLKNFYIELADYCNKKEGNIPKFIQYLFAYDLQWLLKVDTLEVFDNDEELDEFWNVLNKVLTYINMDCIIDNKYIDEHVLPFFVYLKNNHVITTVKSNNSFLVKSGDFTVENFSQVVLWLDIAEYRKGCLNLSGNIESCFENEYMNVKVICESNGEVMEYGAKYVEYNNPKRQTLKYLGINWKYNYNFDTKIPVSLNDKLFFKIEYDDGQTQFTSIPHISFRESCGLSTSSAYFVKDSKIILFKNNKFNVLPYSFKSMLRYEISNLKRINYDKEPHYRFAIFTHMIYFVLYLFMKNKRIWLYSDRPEFADDNAKALFEYSCNIDDGVKKYFIVNKDSPSYNQMKKINKNVVAFGSFKHELLYLFAEKVISSYVNENFINPFHYFTPSLYSGLITSYRYFLQHGVTKDDVSEFIKKYDKNLSLIDCVSDMERESFLADGYNFDNHVIQVLGFCRFDNLTSDDTKKQILFAPTWRLELSNEERFLQSQYYQTLKNFLNNEKLAKLLESTGFELIFKPHPELKDYIELLEVPEHVKVSEDESYQEVFRDSSLLITDYSSVYFDFAYLKKPVIYYQKDDDYHYKEGYFKYDVHGFGPIIKNEEKLINKINDIISNACQMEDKYVERVNEFFKYNDKNNCKRVYEWILNDN